MQKNLTFFRLSGILYSNNSTSPKTLTVSNISLKLHTIAHLYTLYHIKVLLIMYIPTTLYTISNIWIRYISTYELMYMCVNLYANYFYICYMRKTTLLLHKKRVLLRVIAISNNEVKCVSTNILFILFNINLINNLINFNSAKTIYSINYSNRTLVSFNSQLFNTILSLYNTIWHYAFV